MRNGAGSLRLGEAPARSVMRQPRGYSKAVLAPDRRERRAVPAPLRGAWPPTGATHAEENIVAAAFARYITQCEIRRPGASPGGVAMPNRSIGSWLAGAPGRSTELCYADCPKPEAERVC